LSTFGGDAQFSGPAYGEIVLGHIFAGGFFAPVKIDFRVNARAASFHEILPVVQFRD